MENVTHRKHVDTYYRHLFPFLFFCFFAIVARSQAVPVTSAEPKHKPSVPSWITMMDDPNVNYYEAVKAFDAYWKHKVKPVEEDEMDLSKDSNRVKTKEEEREEKERSHLKPSDPAIKYAFEYKRFLHWEQEMEPFVQPDGHIKGMDERLKDWETQKRLKQQQELQQKNKKHQPDSSRKNP
jgi:hypothetical protein